MEDKKLFGRFQRRLLYHGLITAALWGITLGAGALFVCSLVWHILLKAPALIWLWGSFGGGFAAGFIPWMIILFPTKKRTAQRLDQTGLQERAGTMLAFAKKDGLMVKLQRKDAREHIKKADEKALKMKLPVKALIACGICLVLGVTMALLPYNLFAPKVAVTEETLRQQQVHTLINDLRQQVRDSKLSEAAQAEIDALLAQLEQDLLATDNELEQAALIQAAQENIQQVIFSNISRHTIGKALENYALTEELGAQLQTELPSQISEQMQRLKANVSGPVKQISRLSNNIQNALAESGVENTDQLYTAFYTFAQSLDGLLTMTDGPDATPIWTEMDLEFVFEMAELNIVAALENQMHDEAEIENLDSAIRYDLNSLLTPEGGEAIQDPSKDKQQGGVQNAGQNQKPSGGKDGDASGTPVGGLFDSGETNSGPTMMLEGIYDPVSGNVSYGEVFAAYYAQYLEALDAGEIPEELRPFFERYFSSLS